ncbi:MAG: hypothetical protein LIO43_04245 [Clostridiales bacterium]|nr:hypothetical protein [Clostridiales bacterium]
MKKKAVKKALISVSAIFLCAVLIVPFSVYYFRGDIKDEELPVNFEEMLAASVPDKQSNLRIMTSNLLVHYKSCGGVPAKPRAKMFVQMLKSVQPDVVGIQELSDEWYCCVKENLPAGYKLLYPVSTGIFVRMTAMIYNSNSVSLIEKGQMKYKNGDNPRLRRVVWAVFEQKSSGKRFAVTNTHFDLLREGQEKEEYAVMQSQTEELVNLVSNLYSRYNCPVFSAGDFNAMENTESTKPIDAPEIYSQLSSNLNDLKYDAENFVCGNAQGFAAPSYDHIFSNKEVSVKQFVLLSDESMNKMSDHYPAFADIDLN